MNGDKHGCQQRLQLKRCKDHIGEILVGYLGQQSYDEVNMHTA